MAINTTPRGDFTIATAGLDLDKWIQSQLDAHRHEFGFWTYQATHQAIESGRVRVLHENGQPAAMIIRSPSQLIPKIYIAFTHEDARLSDYCRALFTDSVSLLASEACERVRLHTAEDLPANLVWPHLGMQLKRNIGKRGMGARNLLRWELLFPRGEQLDSFLEQQTADPKKKKLLHAFGLEEQFRTAMTRQFRRRNSK